MSICAGDVRVSNLYQYRIDVTAVVLIELLCIHHVISRFLGEHENLQCGATE